MNRRSSRGTGNSALNNTATSSSSQTATAGTTTPGPRNQDASAGNTVIQPPDDTNTAVEQPNTPTGGETGGNTSTTPGNSRSPQVPSAQSHVPLTVHNVPQITKWRNFIHGR